MKNPLTGVLFSTAMALAAPAAAQPDPDAREVTATWIESADGTPLRTHVFRPAGLAAGVRTPVIMEITPYAGSGGAFVFSFDPANQDPPGPPLGRAARMFEKGYTGVVVSLRGYGGSGGCYDFGGAGEQADVVAAVEWAASQPWSTGKVGLTGHSYPGWTQIMALAQAPAGLAAVVPSAPPTGYRNSFTNRVRNFGGGTGFGAFYAASDLWIPSLFADPEEWRNALSGTALEPTCYAEVTAGSLVSRNLDDPYWTERDLVERASASAVPVFYVHGFNDWNVRTSNAFSLYSNLRGPKRGIFGPWDHGISRNGTRIVEATMRFFDRHLKGLAVPDDPPVMVQEIDGSWREETEWPPADAVHHPIALRPGSYLDLPGNFGETGLPAQFPFQPPVPLPAGRGSWTFTEPLPRELHAAGLSRLAATVTTSAADVNLIALLYDVDPEGNARFVTRGAFLVPRSGRYEFDLYPQDWRFPAGHRIGVLLTSADDAWFEPSLTLTPVTIESAELSIPFLGNRRTGFLPDGPFHPRTPHPPFVIDPATIEENTVPTPWPAEPTEP